VRSGECTGSAFGLKLQAEAVCNWRKLVESAQVTAFIGSEIVHPAQSPTVLLCLKASVTGIKVLVYGHLNSDGRHTSV